MEKRAKSGGGSRGKVYAVRLTARVRRIHLLFVIQCTRATFSFLTPHVTHAWLYWFQYSVRHLSRSRQQVLSMSVYVMRNTFGDCFTYTLWLLYCYLFMYNTQRMYGCCIRKSIMRLTERSKVLLNGWSSPVLPWTISKLALLLSCYIVLPSSS